MPVDGVRQAVVLVGGEGTRLRPLTVHTPKPLVPILNVPFLFWMFRWLSRYGVTEVILAAGYLSEPIREACRAARGWGVEARLAVEPAPLGTAGAVKFAEPFLGDRFLVLNGDVFTQFDLGALLAAHEERGADVTIVVTPVEDPGRYGVVEHGGGEGECGRVRRFLEKPAPEITSAKEINAGVYVMERGALATIAADRAVSLEREVFPDLVARGAPVLAYPLGGEYWIDIGTPDQYRQVHWDLLPRAGPLLASLPAGAAGTLADGGEYLLGRGVVLEKLAEVGPRAVIGDDSMLAAGARVKESILWAGCRVGAGSVVEGSVLGKGCRVAPGVTLHGVLAQSGARFDRSP